VRAMIAPPTDIRSAIRVYYGVGKDTASLSEAVAEVDAENAAGARSLRGAALPPPAPSTVSAVATLKGAKPAAASAPIASAPTSQAKEDASRAVPISEPPDSGPQIEAREISMPTPKKGGGRMVTLTLLDGTKVNLPARDGASPQPPPKVPSLAPPPPGSDLTARDLVAALRAVAHGADATEILGSGVRWESAFSALLSLLLKKQLIADWEFVEEYKKQ